uniref:Putative CPRD49 n=1 Tax=Oryza officinalis TaxID=4535 RepID=A0A1V1H761_9ORYZ|nr:putative CPRD49 [Oryza officinalis]
MRPSIVLFGDSITEEAFGERGWGAYLANHYSRSADVVLRGYSGYNTRWAAMVVARAVVAAGAAPAAVTICFGANDASLPDRASALQHVPLPEYKDNLRAICGLLAAAWPSVVVILITPPPVHDAARVRSSPMARHRRRRYQYGDDCSGLPERTNESAGAYARACVDVAAECGLRVIDIWSKMQRFRGGFKNGISLSP